MQTHAGAAKAAIDAMTQHLAVEWGPEGGEDELTTIYLFCFILSSASRWGCAWAY